MAASAQGNTSSTQRVGGGLESPSPNAGRARGFWPLALGACVLAGDWRTRAFFWAGLAVAAVVAVVVARIARKALAAVTDESDRKETP